MNIIFLDIDNVLNNNKTRAHVRKDGINYRGIDLSKVRILKDLVDRTDSKVVLSSTWRLEWEEDNPFRKQLEKKFGEVGVEIYDRTPDINWRLRAQEILEWLNGKEVEHIVILDDEDFFWNRYGLAEYWVDTCTYPCNPFNSLYDGIAKEHVNYIVNNYDKYLYGGTKCEN